jgi:hypothetical protein
MECRISFFREREVNERRNMANLIIQPPVLDLSFYAGDGIAFKLICTNDAEPPVPVDVSGVVVAQVRLDRAAEDPPIVTFSSDLAEAAAGIILLSLTGEQTQPLVTHVSVKPGSGKFTGVWDLEWTADGAEPRTLCQGKVECLADVSR